MTNDTTFNAAELLNVVSIIPQRYFNDPIDMDEVGFQIFAYVDDAADRGITLEMVLATLNKHLSLVNVKIKEIINKTS